MLTAGNKKEIHDCAEEIVRMTDPDEVRYHESDMVDSTIKSATSPVFEAIRKLAEHIVYVLHK